MNRSRGGEAKFRVADAYGLDGGITSYGGADNFSPRPTLMRIELGRLLMFGCRLKAPPKAASVIPILQALRGKSGEVLPVHDHAWRF